MHVFSGRTDRAKLNAMDLISANIMIADANLNITYMNAATRTLLQEAEADLKKELPRFNFSTLIGANIDIFHKNPSHQRSILARLRTQHRATITVGHRVFDLIVTPLGSGEKVTGFVVEWADAKARLLNLDFQNQMEAISRVQAIIAFSPEGQVLTANQNFCDALGYRLDEIVGKNHSLFVEPSYASSDDYERFWSELRSGKFQAAEFVRYGKGGKRVVINASYNPIADEKGNIIKVVKYATDVTQRVEAVDTIGSALKKMAEGDLSFAIDKAFAPDFEALRHNFNAAVNQLRETLSSVSNATRSIDSGSRELSASANDLSKRTEQQAASLEETAAALDQITANVSNASKRAEEARTLAMDANRSAEKSEAVVADAVNAMQRIEASSGQISNIIGVIDEIAFQTNLLALNAGVEAARAGEAGKGFAVVAQEVRELAQRSAQAAKEIKDLIRTSAEEVESGVKLVSATGEALKMIGGYVVSINGQLDAIATSAREQSVGLSEVNTAVNQMDQTTQQNAAMVEEATAASATLAGEADKLRQLVGRFQLGGVPASAYTPAAHGAARALQSASALVPASARHAGAPSLAPKSVTKIARAVGAGGGSAAASADWEEF